jgi:ferric-dicitrate binding protein FerR (iron transport regulator)
MHDEDSNPTGEPSPETELVAGLIRTAGRRTAPPDTSYRRTLELATDAWRSKTARVRRRRRLVWTLSGIAASVSMVVVLLPLMQTVDAPGLPVATLQQVSGRLEVQKPGDAAWQLVREPAATLPIGSRVRTGPGSRAGLTLTGGSSLRLAEGTEVVLDRATRLTLVAGRAYVDSGDGQATGSSLEIVTPIATAREVGTQFEVALLGDIFRLRVREGEVVLEYDERQARAAAGEQLAIGARKPLQRTSILRAGPEWQWVETLAPVPDLDNLPVSELLEWVARETGRDVRYANHEVARRAATTILHGDMRHLAPLEALDVMLATTELEYVAEADGTLLINAKPLD